MIINNCFKDDMMSRNNSKWTSSGEREILLTDGDTELKEKLFITRTYSLNNSEIYGSPNNTNSTAVMSNTCQSQTMHSSSSSDNSSQQHLTPRQFLEKYSLPRVIKIIPQEPIADSCGNFDPITLLSGELLMYKHYQSGKVEARSFPDDRKLYSSLFVIPETYKGWFSVVTERGQTKARVYSSIQRLVSAQVTVFLTMSQDLPAYIQSNSDEITRSAQYTKTSVKSGQVLKLLAVYQDLNSNHSTKSKRLSWPLIGSKQLTSRYAQCLSSSNQVLFINFNTPGQFYAVSMTHNSTEENVTKVYQIQKLLRTFPLPVRVTIIGPKKNHGSMLLENYHKEHVVLSCVLDGADVTTNDTTSEKFRLLEIDVNSKFYVVKPGGRDVDERRLFYSPSVQRALKFCKDSSEQWISQLKIIHHIYPQNSNQILANHQQNVFLEKSKKVRKTSICDKITVKSASFRYSTSYGNENNRPVIKKKDLEKPNKPKVYNFNYKQTHEFLSLSSNVTKDSNSSSQENSIQHKSNSNMPDISHDRTNVSLITRHNQDSNSRYNQKPLGLQVSDGSTSSTCDRNQFRYTNNSRKENPQESEGISQYTTQITSTPTKKILPTNYSSQESKNVQNFTSLPGKETSNIYAHEMKRQPIIMHNFYHNKRQDSKVNFSRSGPISAPMLSPHNSFNKSSNDSNKEEISPVERLDRLTQSCNLLTLLNIKNNSYQNISSSGPIKKNMYKNDRTSETDDGCTNCFTDINVELEQEKREATTQVGDTLIRKPEEPSDRHEQNVYHAQDRSVSLQNIEVKRAPSPDRFDSSKYFHKLRLNESKPTTTDGYNQVISSPVYKVKPMERNSFSFKHQQETPEKEKLTENKPFSIRSKIHQSNNRSRNSSPVDNDYLTRNQYSNQNDSISNQSMSSYVSSNQTRYSKQNVRVQVSKSPSTASTVSNNASAYFHSNKNQNTNIYLPPPALPVKTHNKTPVPMPRLNLSYSKVHDAIKSYNDSETTSSENIYAEISDR